MFTFFWPNLICFMHNDCCWSQNTGSCAPWTYQFTLNFSTTFWVQHLCPHANQEKRSQDSWPDEWIWGTSGDLYRAHSYRPGISKHTCQHSSWLAWFPWQALQCFALFVIKNNTNYIIHTTKNVISPFPTYLLTYVLINSCLDEKFW